MKWIIVLLNSSIFVFGLAGIYYFHGFSANEKYGYGQIDLGGGYFLNLLAAVFFVSFVLGRKYRKPSDFFLLLYGLVVVAPYCILHDIWGAEGFVVASNMIWLVLPFFGVAIICNKNISLQTFPLISESAMTRAILVIAILMIIFLILHPPSTASFSLADSYTRRLEARGLYGVGTFQSYLSGMVMNGVLPLLAFVGVYRNKWMLLLVGLFIYVGFFYVYGVKAPIIYMVFSGIFGYYLRVDGSGRRIYNALFYCLLLSVAFSWLEFLIFDYSYVEDYFIRRLFFVGSHLVGAYFELIGSDGFSWISGLMATTSKSVSMFVGEDFLGSPGTNANTNTFLYFLCGHGVPGYVFAVCLVGCVLSLFNSLSSRNKIFTMISALFSVLVLEQSATTALLSSGIGIVGLLFYFSKNEKSPI